MIDLDQRESNFNTLCDIAVSIGLGVNFQDMFAGLKYNQFGVADASGKTEVEYLGFRDAPAAKGVHHAYLGGLVEHILEMWKYWTVLRLDVQGNDSTGLLNNKNVLTVLIMHDLHKAWTSYVEVESASGVDYGKHPSSSLLTADQKSVYIAQSYGICLDIYQLNALYNSEGGWSASPPKFSSTLAKICYILDELSSNVAARSIGGNVVDVRVNGYVDVRLMQPN